MPPETRTNAKNEPVRWLLNKHLHHDLELLERRILMLGSLVEQATNKAILALVARRPQLAEEVIREDDEIDRQEVECENECLKMLALHQPVAGDLRFIITVLKVNNDLERMGDLAVNIAHRSKYLAQFDPIDSPIDFTEVCDIVRSMVRDSLDALIRRDTVLARKVWAMDDEVDAAARRGFEFYRDSIKRNPEITGRALETLLAIRHLERIADQTTNICEDVVYLVDGEMIRHAMQL
jgi:phosphate transport system protein